MSPENVPLAPLVTTPPPALNEFDSIHSGGGETEVSTTALKKSRGGARVPLFEGDTYYLPVNRLLELDHSGIPVLAPPILQYGVRQGWSTEALLKQASIGQFNTAVRYWFKGQNLSRQSVLEGAAVIVEWYEALMEDRPRRNTAVNMTTVPDIISRLSVSRSRRGGSSNSRKRATSSHSQNRKRSKPKRTVEDEDDDDEDELSRLRPHQPRGEII